MKGHYPSRAMLAGIDLGGTQVRVALARSDGHLVASIKTKTAMLATPQAMVDWAAGEIDRHRGREKVRSITIAAPGPIDISAACSSIHRTCRGRTCRWSR